MAASQEGDKRAYRQLLAELGDTLEIDLQQHFGPMASIEDCVQESLLAIHGARHTYDPKRAFRPWLLDIARHKTTDVLRRAEGQ